MTLSTRIEQAGEGSIEKRGVDGHMNSMAVCSACDKDATQTRISFYVIHAIDKTPLLCYVCAAALRARGL